MPADDDDPTTPPNPDDDERGRDDSGPAGGGDDGGDDGDDGGDGAGRRGWLRDLPATREGAQAAHIIRALPDSTPGPRGWRDRGIDYFHRGGHILVRDEYLERVLALPEIGDGGRVAPGGGLLPGVTLVELPSRRADVALDEHALGAVEAVTATYGSGVASPDHFVAVCPAGWCPATEPEVPADPPTPTPTPPSNPELGAGVRVVVIDLGLGPGRPSPHHPWLAGVTGDPEDAFVAATVPADGQRTGVGPAGEPRIRPYAGHGTFVAGVLRCVAPAADVHVRTAFLHGSRGDAAPGRAGGQFESDLVVTLDAVLAEDSPDVICLPAGTYTHNGQPSLSFRAFGERLRDHTGVVLVTAAGNDDTHRKFWPAAFRWVVGVGALDAAERTRAEYSNFGPWVDVFAPGTDLVNAYLSGAYTCVEPPNTGQVRRLSGMARWSGTSFAAPVVAGLIAARMSVTGENAPKARDGLLEEARTHRIPGVGPTLLPSQR
jgi:hypothetical protein